MAVNENMQRPTTSQFRYMVKYIADLIESMPTDLDAIANDRVWDEISADGDSYVATQPDSVAIWIREKFGL